MSGLKINRSSGKFEWCFIYWLWGKIKIFIFKDRPILTPYIMAKWMELKKQEWGTWKAVAKGIITYWALYSYRFLSLPSFLPSSQFLCFFFFWKYSNKLHKPPSKNRKIWNWTMRGPRHRAILQCIWRKEEINRVKFLFTCWPATHFLPSVMFFFTILEVLLLLIFSYFISYSHWYLCLGLSHYINMWFLCNY